MSLICSASFVAFASCGFGRSARRAEHNLEAVYARIPQIHLVRRPVSHIYQHVQSSPLPRPQHAASVNGPIEVVAGALANGAAGGSEEEGVHPLLCQRVARVVPGVAS